MSSEPQKFKAEIIVEVLGRPPEHLIKTLEGIADQIGQEKGVKLLKKTIHDPVPIKDKEGLFSSYVEIEIELDEIIHIVLIMFKYMPSHVELISPEKIILTNGDFSETLNEITRRLHRYEELVRVMETEKKILENKLRSETK